MIIVRSAYLIDRFLFLFFFVVAEDIIPWTVGRVALVTGAAVRVGKAIAATLHRRGFKVAIHYNRSKDEAEAFAAELNRSTNFYFS